jgi:hypothetical protein
MRRVVQFSTGNVGRHSLQAITGRPDLELVGMHAASPNKIGRDAAELCGLSNPTGVIATDDIDVLIALKPDCVVYTAQGETRPMEAIEQMSKFLAAGINIVATSTGRGRDHPRVDVVTASVMDVSPEINSNV